MHKNLKNFSAVIALVSIFAMCTPGFAAGIGARLPDGTVYASISPDTKQPLYAAAEDLPAAMPFDAAKGACTTKKDSNGNDGFRLPTLPELKVLFDNRDAIGGFNETGLMPVGYYWSSTPSPLTLAWVERFSDGLAQNNGQLYLASVRCVRD